MRPVRGTPFSVMWSGRKSTSARESGLRKSSLKDFRAMARSAGPFSSNCFKSSRLRSDFSASFLKYSTASESVIPSLVIFSKVWWMALPRARL